MEPPPRYDISHKNLFRSGSAVPGFRSDDCALSRRAVAAAECGAVSRKTAGRSVDYAGDWLSSADRVFAFGRPCGLFDRTRTEAPRGLSGG